MKLNPWKKIMKEYKNSMTKLRIQKEWVENN